MKIPLAIIMIILLGSAGPTRGFDIGTATSDGLGGALSISNPTPAEIVQLPALGGTTPAALQSWYRREYEMRAFDQISVAFAAIRQAWSLSVGLGQFGHSDLYRELTARVGLAYHWRKLSLSTSWSGMMVDFGSTYERLQAGTIDLAVVWRAAPVYLALRGEDLTSPQLSEHDPGRDPRYSAYAEWQGPGPYRFVGRVTVQNDQRLQLGLGQIIDLSSRAAFFWGIGSEATRYGGGLNFSLGRRQVTYVAAYHPALGLTHSVSLSLNFASSLAAP
jgi:hypothetical protein